MPARFSALIAAVVALAGFATAGAVSARAHESSGCWVSDYSYAGLYSARAYHGFSADVTVLKPSLVKAGHVAGWIDVGDSASGPGGTPEWLQVGYNSAGAGDTGNHLYWEYYAPHVPDDYHYHQVTANVPVGESHRLVILEMAHKPGYWRVWVDGSAVSPPLALPAHPSFQGDFSGETWGGNGSPVCNGFAYRFDRMRAAATRGGSWVRIGQMDPTNNEGYVDLRPRPDSMIAELRPELWPPAVPTTTTTTTTTTAPTTTVPTTTTTTTTTAPTTTVPSTASVLATGQGTSPPLIVPPRLPGR